MITVKYVCIISSLFCCQSVSTACVAHPQEILSSQCQRRVPFFSNMENVLQEINRRFISLPDEDVRRNNKILESVLSTFIDKMKTKDPLFKAMFRRVFYGGSYYDGLRVGRPEEFDLDLLLHVPVYSEPTLTEANIPGFVFLQLKKLDAWMKQPEAMPAYRNFHKLLDDKLYFSTTKTLAWMESVVQQSLNDLPYRGGAYILENHMGIFQITWRKSGPALTLHISGNEVQMDVDLVPCFVFGGDKWPINGFRSNPFPSSKPEFFIVPKKPKATGTEPIPRYWRLSFQEQERALMDNKRTLKPTIKLLKKMRDNLQHTPIASYYIKTVLLHIVAQKEDDFWRKPLSQVFMTVLKEYRESLKDQEIPYYWNKRNNLIKNVNTASMSGRLAYVIRDIENNPDQPDTVAKYLLTRDEYRAFVGMTTNAGYFPEAQAVPQPASEESRCVIL